MRLPILALLTTRAFRHGGDLVAPAPLDPAERRERLHRIYDGFRPAFAQVVTIEPDAMLAAASADPAVLLVDVRSDGERAVSTLPGAVPAAVWRGHPERFADRRVVAFCTMGIRSGAWAADRLAEGHEVANLARGVLGWTHAGGPLVDASGAPTRQVHVGAKTWNLLPPGYDGVTSVPGRPPSALRAAFPGALLVATAGTLADGVWALDLPEHQWVSGVVHGAAVFLTLGGFLGARASRPWAGAVGGALSGAVAAASFYVLVPVGGYGVMFVSWWILWLMLAAVQGELWPARVGRRPAAGVVLRLGTRAALAAAVGFSFVFFVLYGGWSPTAFAPWLHAAAWTVAYLPGLAVLVGHELRSQTPTSA